MALTSKQRAKQLENLLDAAERGSKRDASDYTSGHLNESNLHKPPEFSSHKEWRGARQKTFSLSKGSNLPFPHKQPSKSKHGMSDILAEFSLGNDGFLPTVKGRKQKPKPINNTQWNTESSDSVNDKALIEELDSRRFMLNRSQPPRLSRSWATEDDDADTRHRNSKSVPPKHEFYSFKSGATKRDQFKDFKLFENGTLRKKDILLHKALSGEQVVRHLEQQLTETLTLLGDGPGTSFHRLQAHSGTLQQILESSPLFSYILKQIKTEYDDYVGWLLDTHPTQSYLLREQVNDLYEKRISNPLQLRANLNEKLRVEVREAKESSTRHTLSPDLYSRKQDINRDEKSQFDLADQLQDLHATILARLDELDEMRSNLREDYVPSSVCQNLEQCLKDTEVEVQKLLKQNEIMEKKILDMEDDITSAVDGCEVSRRDKEKCREKITRTRVPGIKRGFDSYEAYDEFMQKYADDKATNLFDPMADGESSEDEDEKQTDKWEWYIS
ncbi:C6orf118 [Bugula neritina]|uniref:C6orf118 n=1 Tax=Bugula neritina TaxID=10212 RepID=A0A7J7IWJ0_BUGNE|nr:C6orf118 [Bugula neritina]